MNLTVLKDVPGEIRTPDRRLRRPLLYPAELLGHGAGEENRTLDQSLEGSCFTTKLHPHILFLFLLDILSTRFIIFAHRDKVNTFFQRG